MENEVAQDTTRRAGFWRAKIWRAGPWTIVYVYTSGHWSSVWRADPNEGRVEDMAEWGPFLGSGSEHTL